MDDTEWRDVREWAIRENAMLEAHARDEEDLVLSPQSCRDMASWLRRLRIFAEAADTVMAPAPPVPEGYLRWEVLTPTDLDPDQVVAVLLRKVARWCEETGGAKATAAALNAEAARVMGT